jgi:hypothetical protein
MQPNRFLVNFDARVRANRPGPLLPCFIIDPISNIPVTKSSACKQFLHTIRTHSIRFVPSAVATHGAYRCFGLVDAWALRWRDAGFYPGNFVPYWRPRSCTGREIWWWPKLAGHFCIRQWSRKHRLLSFFWWMGTGHVLTLTWSWDIVYGFLRFLAP